MMLKALLLTYLYLLELFFVVVRSERTVFHFTHSVSLLAIVYIHSSQMLIIEAEHIFVRDTPSLVSRPFACVRRTDCYGSPV